MSTLTPRQQVWSHVDIRGPEMVWVLLAHLYALLVPLAIVVGVALNWDYVVSTTDAPFLFFVAACLLAAGGAFEAAQNTADRWYLTKESASADGQSLLDFMFYWMVTAGQAVSAVAIAGRSPVVVVVAVVCILALPALYLSGGPYMLALVVSSLLAIVLAFRAFGDPVVFLQLLVVAATMYFFAILLRTMAQVMHGFTTFAASSGAWFLLLAISDGANGVSASWTVLIAVVVVCVLAGAALWPALIKLPASRRAGVVGPDRPTPVTEE